MLQRLLPRKTLSMWEQRTALPRPTTVERKPCDSDRPISFLKSPEFIHVLPPAQRPGVSPRFHFQRPFLHSIGIAGREAPAPETPAVTANPAQEGAGR